MGLARFLFAFLLAACAPQPAAVIASPDAVRVMDAQVVLEAVVVNRRGATMDVPVSWTTTDPAVVTVDNEGRLSAVRSGKATVRAVTGNLWDDVLVEVDRFASARLEVPVLLTEGEGAPLSWSALDDAGGPWEGAVACTTRDDAVVTVAEGQVVAIRPGTSTVTCVASGGSVDARVRVLPSEWDAFAWRRATSVIVAEGVVVPFSSDEVPSDDWLRMTEAFVWRTESGRPAYVVLTELLDLSVAFSCRRGQAIVVTPGGAGLNVGTRIDLGAQCQGIPSCPACIQPRSDTLAPPRFTATGLEAGGALYTWRNGTLVQSP